MQVNVRPDRWHSVPPTLFLAMQEAFRAHQRSKGRVDPRVLRSLVGLGYDRSLPFSSGGVTTGPAALSGVAGPGGPVSVVGGTPSFSSAAIRSISGASGRGLRSAGPAIGPDKTWTSS